MRKKGHCKGRTIFASQKAPTKKNGKIAWAALENISAQAKILKHLVSLEASKFWTIIIVFGQRFL